MISASIDLSKVDKQHLTPGKTGASYLSLILRAKPSKYGDDGLIIQGVSKEKREQGIKGPILGNYREYRHEEDRKPVEEPKEPAKPLFPPDKDDDVPY